MSHHRGLAAAAILALGVGAGSAASAAEPAGTIAEPIVIDQFPYAHASTTVDREAAIASYSCASSTREEGGEAVYRLTTPAEGRLYLHLRGDTADVDVDVHLLDGTTVTGGVAGDCLARANVYLEADVPAGTYHVVVDTYSPGGAPEPGPYELRVDFAALDAWRERPIAEGVIWRSRVFPDLYGGVQTVNLLDVDLAAPGLSVRPIDSIACETTSAMAVRMGALAGVNGGFFDNTDDPECSSFSLLKTDGDLIDTNAGNHTSFGLTAANAPAIAIVADGADWPEMRQAIGGGPNLATDSAVLVNEEGFSWEAERHPRTALGVTADAHVLLVTFDGRTSHGAGVVLADLGDFLIGEGAVNAMNLDGGGSTTMVVAGATPSGIVNYPSGGSERRVSNGLFLFAPPYDHPPRFTTTPSPTEATVGIAWTYDADAVDLDLQPLVFAAAGPAGLVVDAASGEASWTPTWRDGGARPVTLGVSDGAHTVEQAFTITVSVPDLDEDGMADAFEDEFGVDDPAADPDDDGATNLEEYGAGTDPTDPASHPGGGAADAGAPGGDGGTSGSDGATGGCGCRLASRAVDGPGAGGPGAGGPGRAAGGGAALLAVALSLLARRRRR